MKNTLKTLTLVSAVLGVGSVASAQNTTQIDRPFKVELGAFQATTNIAGSDEKLGGTFALGYRFLRLQESIDLEVELRGKAYNLEFGFGDVDVSLSELLVNGYYRQANNPLFFTAGLGFGRGEIRGNGQTFQDGDTDFVYQLGVGYQFQPTLYGALRYHGGNEDGYRGFSLGVGYRF